MTKLYNKIIIIEIEMNPKSLKKLSVKYKI